MGPSLVRQMPGEAGMERLLPLRSLLWEVMVRSRELCGAAISKQVLGG